VIIFAAAFPGWSSNATIELHNYISKIVPLFELNQPVAPFYGIIIEERKLSPDSIHD
jgi:hypothetical protein